MNYMESSIFTLFWNMARRLIHRDISQDIEEFLKSGISRMDNKGKQRDNNTYTIKYEEEVYEFQQGELASPVGFFTSNYSRYVVKYKVQLGKLLTKRFRAIHKEAAPYKYSLFWTTDRSLQEDGGGISLLLIMESGFKEQKIPWWPGRQICSMAQAWRCWIVLTLAEERARWVLV